MNQTTQFQWTGLVKQALRFGGLDIGASRANDAKRDLTMGGAGALAGAGLGVNTPAKLFQRPWSPHQLEFIQGAKMAPFSRLLHSDGGMKGLPMMEKVKGSLGAGLLDVGALAAKHPRMAGGVLGAAELGGLGLLLSRLSKPKDRLRNPF